MKHTGYTPGPWEIKGYSVFMGNGPNASGANLTKFGALGETEFWANARLIADAPRLAEENERLRELLSHLTHEYRQIFKPVEDSPGFIWMMLHKQFLEDVKAALSGREEGK